MDPIKGVAPVRDSIIFSALDRIDTKMSHLQMKLEPIICSVPKGGREGDVAGDTELSRRLRSVEDSITYLLDSIQL